MGFPPCEPAVLYCPGGFSVLTLVLGLLAYTPAGCGDLMDWWRASCRCPEPYIWKLISGTFDNTSRLWFP